MKLVQLIYYSEMTSKPEDILRDLKSILASARRHNTAMGISGALAFSNRYFLQLIEGTRQNVNELYTKIQSDKRHAKPQILLYRDIHRRDFGDWSMGWASGADEKTDVYFRYCAGREFEPSDLTGEAALQLLKDFVPYLSDVATA